VIQAVFLCAISAIGFLSLDTADKARFSGKRKSRLFLRFENRKKKSGRNNYLTFDEYYSLIMNIQSDRGKRFRKDILCEYAVRTDFSTCVFVKTLTR